VYENRFLRRLFGSKRDEVTWEWRKLHNEKLNDLYCKTNIVRVIKIEKNYMGWSCGTNGEEIRTGFWWGNLKERDHLEDHG
jgi:hypothetical protein